MIILVIMWSIYISLIRLPLLHASALQGQQVKFGPAVSDKSDHTSYNVEYLHLFD